MQKYSIFQIIFFSSKSEISRKYFLCMRIKISSGTYTKCSNRIYDLVYLICLSKFLKTGAKSLSKDQHKEIAGLFNDKALI